MAFAVVRASLHPLMLLVDHHRFQWPEEDFTARFIVFADELPPLAWVVLGHVWSPPNELETFHAERKAERIDLPFGLDNRVAAVGRGCGSTAG
jgi:hypothetical protein